MTFTTWMILGLCTINMQDDELTMRTCQAVYEAKFRSVISFDMAIHKAEAERSKVLLWSWEGRFYRNHFLNLSGIVDRKVMAYAAAHSKEDEDSNNRFPVVQAKL